MRRIGVCFWVVAMVAGVLALSQGSGAADPMTYSAEVLGDGPSLF